MVRSLLPNREFLQLANKYKPGKSKIAGWYWSEKLDGTRCLWDGGISRGMRTEDVPWASVTDPKTGKRKAKIKPIATGLWSRYGNPIMAPDDFLNLLPCVPLDGELWAGRGNFQLCRSICGGDSPDARFSQIEFAVYGTPPLGRLLMEGRIKNANMVVNVDSTFHDWVHAVIADTDQELYMIHDDATFNHEILTLQEYLETDRVYLLKQSKLPEDEAEAQAQIEVELERVLELGAEGVVLRDPRSVWTPKRVPSLLKYKPYQDTEAVLVGFTSGRETDKGSKHLGKIGALILRYRDKRLEVSGLNDEERLFATDSMSKHAAENPGKDMPADFRAKHFTLGQQITVKFRELTTAKDDGTGGVPKEATYLRKRDEE